MKFPGGDLVAKRRALLSMAEDPEGTHGASTSLNVEIPA